MLFWANSGSFFASMRLARAASAISFTMERQSRWSYKFSIDSDLESDVWVEFFGPGHGYTLDSMSEVVHSLKSHRREFVTAGTIR